MERFQPLSETRLPRIPSSNSSTQVSLPSAKVGAMIAYAPGGFSDSICESHSAPAFDFPAPRPACRYHTRQSPSGATCSARAVRSQRSRW